MNDLCTVALTRYLNGHVCTQWRQALWLEWRRSLSFWGSWSRAARAIVLSLSVGGGWAASAYAADDVCHHTVFGDVAFGVKFQRPVEEFFFAVNSQKNDFQR